MPSDANLMVKSIGESRVGGRKPCTLKQAIRHNRRDIQAELGAIERIDARRTSQNIIIAGQPTWQDVLADAKEILEGAGIDSKTLRRDWVQAIEFVFTLDGNSTVPDWQAYWLTCVRWLREKCGMHVLSADVHRDEAHEHLHCLVSPVHHGQLRGGKLIDFKAFPKLMQSFWQNVAGPAGLRPPQPKLRGHAKTVAAQLVIDHLAGLEDPTLRSTVWALHQKAIRDDPVPYLEKLGIPREMVRKHLIRKQSETTNPMHCRDLHSNGIEFTVRMTPETGLGIQQHTGAAG